MPLALAYLRYNLKPASPSNLASMLLNRGFQLVSVYINTYIILIFHGHCNEHCKLMSKESAF